MQEKNKAVRKIITFLVLVIVFSIPLYYLIIHSGSLQTAGGIYVFILMWAPGISGLLTQLIHEKSLRGMGWKIGKPRYLLIAYLAPLVYCLVAYGIIWLSGLGGFPNPEFISAVTQGVSTSTSTPAMLVLRYCVSLATLGVLMGILSGAGEEIGWRGLFVPELAKVTSFTKTVFLSGAVWTIWHLPLILFADYSLPGVPKAYAVLMFTIMVLGINTLFSWLRLKSGSLWPAALLHASHNVFVQAIFTPLTLQSKLTPWLIDEFGAGLAFAGVVLALIFLRKGKDLGLKVQPVNES